MIHQNWLSIIVTIDTYRNELYEVRLCIQHAPIEHATMSVCEHAVVQIDQRKMEGAMMCFFKQRGSELHSASLTNKTYEEKNNGGGGYIQTHLQIKLTKKKGVGAIAPSPR